MLAATLILFASMAASPPAQMSTGQMAAHAKKARAAERQGNFSIAAEEYKILAAALPENAEVQSNLGVALYLNHQLPQAIAVFRKAISLKPELLAPHLFSGMALYQLSESGRAIPELEKAVHLNPSDIHARIWLGYAYTAQSQNGAALKEFEAATQIAPTNTNAWYQLGEAWLQAGTDATTRLFTVAPNGGRAWELAGEQAQLMGNHAKALADFKKAEARRPDIPELRSLITGVGGTVTAGVAPTQSGSGHEEEDRLYREARRAESESQAAFERVFQLAPNSYRAHQITANSYVAEGKDSDAIAEYRTVLKLKPDLVGIHEAMGEALVRDGQLPAALKEFNAELQMQPHSAKAHMNAGRALLLMGKDADAEKLLRQALKMDRPPPETYLLLGRIDVRRRDYQGAVPLLKQYVSEVKGNSTAYYLLAMAYRNLGNRDEMKTYLALYKKTSRDAKERR